MGMGRHPILTQWTLTGEQKIADLFFREGISHGFSKDLRAGWTELRRQSESFW